MAIRNVSKFAEKRHVTYLTSYYFFLIMPIFFFDYANTILAQ